MGELIKVNVIAGVAIKQDGRYLLVQEYGPGDPSHGLWGFPSGRVEEGETIEAAAIREAKEESGYEVKIIRKLGIFQVLAEKPVMHIFAAKISGGELRWPQEEISQARWLTPAEVREMKDQLRNVAILEAVEIAERGN